MTHLDFWPPGVQVYLVSKPLNGLLGVTIGQRVEFSLAVLVPGQSSKFTVMHLDFLATRGPNLFSKQNPQMAL